MATAPTRRLTVTSVKGGWTLVADGFDPLHERGIEAVFAVANGAFGVRGALEGGNTASNPMLIVAGLFVPSSSPARETLAVLPDPASLEAYLDGRRLGLPRVRTLDHRRLLDLKRATMKRDWCFLDAADRAWRWQSLRVASAAEDGSYLWRLVLSLLDGADEAQVRLAFPWANRTDGARPGDSVIHMFAGAGATLTTVRRLDGDSLELGEQSLSAVVRPGRPLVLESVSRLATPGADPPPGPASRPGAILRRHAQVWRQRWDAADLSVDGDRRLQEGARLALYHLLSSGRVNEGETSIGARNLSGEGYHGHVFWDTEIFVLPALMLAWPEAARSSLLYRYRTLDQARKRAREYGYAGALYAWESTASGEDMTPVSAVLPSGRVLRILNGEQENHISAAVPYAVHRYWTVTGDDDFMRRYGAEMLFECARFWYSRLSPADGALAIRRVIGPDEYHVNVDNDAYTNAMAAWVLEEAARYAARLQAEDPAVARALLERLEMAPDEPEEWARAAPNIVRSRFTADEVVEQFDGFFAMTPVDVGLYRQAGVALDIAVGSDTVQQLRAVKQADVLMAGALLPDRWNEAALRANFAYYEPLTAHGSSLSPPIHALLAAWLRDGRLFTSYIHETVAIDLADGCRGAAAGVHMAALGGVWQALVLGLAGFKPSETDVGFDPFLPEPLTRLAFGVLWRGRRLRVSILPDEVQLAVEGPACEVRVNRQRQTVRPREQARFPFDPSLTYWSSLPEGGSHDD